MMEKTFDPASVEARVSALWDAAGAFKAGRPERLGAEPYVIVIPPPNVTGSLHIGHALNNTLQDVLCRYHRMRGKDVLWQPGTDHAGIATQMVVERQMADRQEPGRREIGREAFLAKVWAWKEESGGTIVRQLRRLGASCDWSRERFTMDAGLSAAVVEFFVRLYEAGLIYKDKRLVNWDPKFQTAISDLEVMQVEVKGSFKWQRPAADDAEPKALDMAALRKLLMRQPGGHLYHLDYPLADGSGVITVATTRPETMLGDTAVAVHPEDERYRHLVGQMVRLPLVNRLVPIVADSYSDPEKGTGAVKITPAHDFNDFDVGKRHGLRVINIFSREAALTLKDNSEFALAGPALDPSVLALDGLDRFAARAQMIERLAECGALRQIEPTVTQVPHGDRSNDVIEPYLTEQWYVNTRPLADAAMASVRDGRTRIIPEQQEAAFFRWMENIEPWCISRQLWWGHQIPAWYGPDGTYIVARDEAEALKQARARWGADCAITRDEDVLDTWFSSALWPFSTLGWPDASADLARYYPTSTLVTAADILFFWVARMMMAGLFTQNEVPFRDVYLHGLVRDEKGAKMSKSKGNVLDPLTIIDAYGADALRFAICINANQGRDIKLGMKSAELYRNFCTKIWNAARFAEMNGCALQPGFEPAGVHMALNRWILGELTKARAGIMAGIEGYRFNEAASAAYRFTWNLFCDWYLELSKPILQQEDGPAKAETRATTAYVLDAICQLLHPFMPFLTEELWRLTGASEGRSTLLCLTAWPDAPIEVDSAAEAEIGFVVDVISEVRSARAEMGVPAAAQIPLVLVRPRGEAAAHAARWGDLIRRLGRISTIDRAEVAPPQSVQVLVRGEVVVLPLAGVIDIGAEKARLEREQQKCVGDIAAVDARLGNPDFVAKAPDEVIEEHKERREAALARKMRIAEALSRL